MNAHVSDSPKSRKPLRVWPGVVLAVLAAIAWYVVPVAAPDYLFKGVQAALGLVGAILLWWLLFSRAAWYERIGAVVLMAAAIAAVRPLLHESIRTAAMSRMFFILAIPPLFMALVAWAAATRRLPDGLRRLTLVATVLLACGAWALVKTGGIMTSRMKNDYMWRWSPTPEDRLVAQAAEEPLATLPPSAPPPAPVDQATPAPTTPLAKPSPKEPPTLAAEAPAEPAGADAPGADWPGFRGPRRDGAVHGIRIRTDWSSSPPAEMWRRKVGPGWSSFSVRGDLFYTQEQRGEDEVVAAYRLSTGKPVWRHHDKVRFWESIGGAGPRATPTVHGGRVYTLGATGILNSLDARTGAVVWSRNAAADTETKTPGWGFSGSPLVVDDLVVVATAGTLAAYDLATGAPRWEGPPRAEDYSSPQLATIGGVPQILLLHGKGATAVSPADGTLLWEHELPSGARIVQPGLTADGDVLLTYGQYGTGNGIRRVAVRHEGGGWTSSQLWESQRLKPDFNDYVVHRGHAFGFDGTILVCIDLADGQRKWKGGRYGNGQVVLLADQDLLLVLSEEGELALVGATPDQFGEIARFEAIAGKTWNHPVLAGDVLLVRNGEEMAAFRLALADPPPQRSASRDASAQE